MFILDDADQLPPTKGEEWEIRSNPLRYPSMPHKYAALVKWAEQEYQPDIYVLWDDDDIYLPLYISDHVDALEHGLWSHPSHVYSLYTGKVEAESAKGRFWAAGAFRKEAYDQLGGLLGVMPRGVNKSEELIPGDRRADFDQRFLAALNKLEPPQEPNRPSPTFIYRWGSTLALHSSAFGRSPEDESWYERYGKQTITKVHEFSPELDYETKTILQSMTPRVQEH
jgi:hypothetical protein